MDRRSALWIGLGALLDACGGGGGGSIADVSGTASPAPSPAAAPPPPAPAPIAALSPNIACWGDSLTVFVAANLQVLVTGRTVYNGGFVGQTSTFIADQQTADNTMTSWISVFWYGHNNDKDPVTIKADIARSIAHLAPGNRAFLVLSLLNQDKDGELKGQAGYDTIIQLNADLAALYPDHYVDVRSLLIASFDPNNPQDLVDVQNDVLPSSLRYDEIHLRNEGSVIVAQRVKDVIAAKGW
jgi:lysophospholipase L1-like esterase